MKLQKMSDLDLRVKARQAAHKFRGSDAEIILFIQEVDHRDIVGQWGFKNLISWVEDELELCEGSAHLRINAARMLNEFPQIASKIEEGKLNISTLSLAQTYFNENKVKDSFFKAQILSSIEGLSKRKAEKKLFELSGKRKLVQERMDRVSADSFKVTFELNEKTIELLKKILSMVHKKLSYDEIIFLALTALMKEVTKKILKTEVMERRSKGTNVHGKTFSNRAIREAAKRSGGVCEICNSTEKLQKDHRFPRALGGLSTENNCRILCRTCNRREAIKRGLLHPGEVKFIGKRTAAAQIGPPASSR